MKLHLGCGSVYLLGYINIDAVGFTVEQRPDLLKVNGTTLDHYYKYPYKVVPFGQESSKEILVDRLLDVGELTGFEDNSVDEILSVNLINHLRFQDFQMAVENWWRVLKPGGRLIIDVDDVVEMARAVVQAKSKSELEKALRYLYCHSRNEFDSHHWGYTDKYLKELLKSKGFKFGWRNDDYIYHDADYPRFLVCFIKK